ncbi:MAG: hypothetical protein H6R42_379 [Nitrospirae bacterium]|nr:hypothetical protein [Nitrospirota bacterium]
MNLRQVLKDEFGIDFPISGGPGTSRENPIIIHHTIPNDYTSVEYAILQCLGLGREIAWKLLQQLTLNHNERTLDRLKIETTQVTEGEIITQVENYYFDITECVGAHSCAF